MKTSRKPSSPRAHRSGFTLVELLVVITIIGILAGLALPAIRGALEAANETSMRMELESISTAIERYQQEFGDYPPDFSSWAVVQRHYNKVFPRMSADDLALLQNMLAVKDNSGNPTAVYNATAMDRAEAIVWTIGGYSKDTQRPFTGDGGPLVWVGNGSNSYDAATSAQRRLESNYQVNSDRVNSLFDFEPSRLNLSKVDASMPLTGNNRYLSTDDNDLFPAYSGAEDGAPIVYFDSRTYAHFDANTGASGDFNGYGNTALGFVRPYYSAIANNNPTSGNYADFPAALRAWEFMNKNTFQLISPGVDGSLGSTASLPSGAPVYFQFPTGQGISPRTDVALPGGLLLTNANGFQESGFNGAPENLQLDNLTNFAKGKLVNEVP